VTPAPRIVVIPFGVPPEGEGLGLGLAALVHVFAHVEGESVALAQLLARPPSDNASPVETFLPPDAWKSLAAQGDAPSGVSMVVTGSFHPPASGGGHIQLLAFDPRDGRTRARGEAHLDGASAGRTLLAVLDEVWRAVGGDLGPLVDIGDLEWDALESVLRAERCVLHDPRRGGPHDRLAAMMHLGRAVGDAPDARFPAGRLAAVAMEAALAPSDRKVALGAAALRALARAAEDAPAQVELLEAAAALHVRLGGYADAETAALAVIARSPNRPRTYALLSEARRMRGDLDGARAAVERGAEIDQTDPILLTERGVLLATNDDLAGARAAWEKALEREPLFAPAFGNLASLFTQHHDVTASQGLVDRALAGRALHPEILRRAIVLALASETEGVARASRVATLARRLLERVSNDAWAMLALARASSDMGERSEAIALLLAVEEGAVKSALAGEAARLRFAIESPLPSQELEAVLRASMSSETRDLAQLRTRARRLAEAHEGFWLAHYAVGIAERRSGEWASARAAFERVLTRCEGYVAAHMELVAACMALGDHEAAIAYAERACSLEGEGPRTSGALAAAFFAAGRRDEALAAVNRALAVDPNDEANVLLAARIRSEEATDEPPRSFIGRFLDRVRG
jgi:tetratricopeptide (TPR) repeat protein